MTINLRQARETGKLKEFIAEHEKDAPGDADAAEKIVRSMAGKSTAARPASDKARGDG